MATEFTAADLELARTVRADIEQRGGYTRPYGEFRSRIAQAGISLNSTASSKLWRAADREAASGSETGGGSEEEADDGVTPELEGEEQGLTFEEISASHFGPIQDNETLSDYEERVFQGLALVRPSDYDRTEKAMLQALQQGHFYLEMKQMGLTASQVRTLLKGMAAKIKETKAAFAYRYVNTFAVYVRVVGPTAYEESLKTKARRLLVAADLPVPEEFEGPEISLSSGHSQNFQSPSGAPGPGTPPRRREHFIGTPMEQSPPFPVFNGFSSPKEER